MFSSFGAGMTLKDRHIVIRAVIEFRAFAGEAAAFDDDVVAIGVVNEVERVHMPVFKIHAMHVVAARAIDDAADLRPDRRSFERGCL